MIKLGFMRNVILLILLGWTALGFAQISATQTLPFAPQQNGESFRTLYLSDLISQNNDSGWEDDTKSHVSYNNQGLCSAITIYLMQSGAWTLWKKKEYTYNNNNQLLQTESSVMLSDGWFPNQRTEYTYDGSNLVRIGHHTLYEGSWVCPDYVDLSYHADTGILNYAVSTYEPMVVPIWTRYKYVYQWDTQGRKRIVLIYFRDNSTPDWVLGGKQDYTYLPEDQSTYAQHYQYVVDGFADNETRFYNGHNPFLSDETLLLTYWADGDIWNHYLKWDYIYDQELKLTCRQYFVYDEGYELEDETRYEYVDNRVSSETSYSPYDGELYPQSRILYVYSDTGVDEDYNASPAHNKLNLYPNPFRQATTIEFELAKAGAACISVYNLKGQKVREICSDTLERGQHLLTWDGKDGHGRSTKAGIYFIRLSTQGKSVVRKVIRL